MNTLYETPEKTLEELKDLCTRTVPPADVYAAIDGVGLWLGPNFQVAKEVYISGTVRESAEYRRLSLKNMEDSEDSASSLEV